MGRSKIPDGWLNYMPVKDAFPEARIIPIKVPLPIHRFQDPVMHQYRWTPADVMHRIPNLGLIIDTTYKRPAYYDTYEFQSQGIEYAKIMCAGQCVPVEEVYRQFSDVVKMFVEHPKNDGKIIAMHCTHGINRTGYLLCRYLVENHSYTPDEALYAFASKRGHPVERENYKEALYSLPTVRRF